MSGPLSHRIPQDWHRCEPVCPEVEHSGSSFDQVLTMILNFTANFCHLLPLFGSFWYSFGRHGLSFYPISLFRSVPEREKYELPRTSVNSEIIIFAQFSFLRDLLAGRFKRLFLAPQICCQNGPKCLGSKDTSLNVPISGFLRDIWVPIN